MHRILACWLLVHAALSTQVVFIRVTSLMEWSAVLMLIYVPIVLFSQRKKASPAVKRWTWLTLAYVPFVSIGALCYGFWFATRNWSSTGMVDMDLTVPSHDPLYLILTSFSVICAITLAVMLSKNERAKPVEPVA